MTDTYILGPGGIAIPEPDPVKWGKAYEESQRHIAVTQVGGSRISTVFLGIDHSFGRGPPVLWETMVFGGKLDGEMDRYSTREDAERGHNEMVGRVTRQALPTKRYP